jgi:hypothetical protein
MNRLGIPCYADFYVWNFETWVEYGFMENPPVEETMNSMEQKTVSLLSN